LCVEDYIDALKWAAGLGGLAALHARADNNAAMLAEWVERTPWIDFLCADPALRSNTSVCLKIIDPDIVALAETDQRAFVKTMEKNLAGQEAAYDIGGYRDAPPGLRIWCGATVERDDIEALCPWLDWAFADAKASL
jgi:phosphoserine aminotransferase